MGGRGWGAFPLQPSGLSAPRSLKATSVAAGGVTLKWTAPKGAKPEHYLVLRDGKSLGKTTRTSYTDTKVKPGRRTATRVRALDERKRAGALSPSVRVKVPKAEELGPPARRRRPTRRRRSPTVTPTPPRRPPPATPTADADRHARRPVAPTRQPATATATPRHRDRRPPTPDADPPDQLTAAMVDRLFWRAGFGPTQAQRDAWTGKTHAELVDWFLNTPSALERRRKPRR